MFEDIIKAVSKFLEKGLKGLKIKAKKLAKGKKSLSIVKQKTITSNEADVAKVYVKDAEGKDDLSDNEDDSP